MLNHLGLATKFREEPNLSRERAGVDDSQSFGIADLSWLDDGQQLPGELSKFLREVRQAQRPKRHAYVSVGQWGITPRFVETKYPKMDFNDDGHKLLLLFRYWNIVEYFYPYKQHMDDNWHDILAAFVPRFIEETDEVSLKLLLLELVATLRDGHAFIVRDDSLDRYFGERQLPLELSWIEGRPVVASLFVPSDAEAMIRAGDILLSIDGASIDDLVDLKKKYVSAASEAAVSREVAQLLIRTQRDKARIVVQRAERQLAIEIDTIPYDVMRLIQRDFPASRKVHERVACLYPGALKPGEIDQLLGELKDEPALVIDYRCYPSLSLQEALPDFLFAKPMKHFTATQFVLSELGHYTWKPVVFAGHSQNECYAGRVAVLVNEYTQSQPEFEILALCNRPDLVIIGSQTAGSVGNWTPIPLPGNITTSFSGNGIYTHDRKQVQRVGVTIDIEVRPTLEGIRNGRDEVMEKAIECLNQ